MSFFFNIGAKLNILARTRHLPVTGGHSSFNPAPPEAGLKGGCSQDWLPHSLT
jgi:hypothetical protein